MYEWKNVAENDIDMCWNGMSNRVNTVIDKLCPFKEFMSKDLGQQKKSCVEVSLPTLMFGPTLNILKDF